ncbi:MAG: hypothetical protein PHT92_11115 [Bacteroidales bacterium]|nr:hypothetical protein [Bacteroidales bacterium]
MSTVELLIPIVAIVFSHSLAFGIIYIYLRNRNRERMQMLEKGIDPSIFLSKSKSSHSIALKYGLFLVGIALGTISGALLYQNKAMEAGPAYFSMILLFGGMGLMAYYLIERKKDDRTNG